MKQAIEQRNWSSTFCTEHRFQREELKLRVEVKDRNSTTSRRRNGFIDPLLCRSVIIVAVVKAEESSETILYILSPGLLSLDLWKNLHYRLSCTFLGFISSSFCATNHLLGHHLRSLSLLSFRGMKLKSKKSLETFRVLIQ